MTSSISRRSATGTPARKSLPCVEALFLTYADQSAHRSSIVTGIPLYNVPLRAFAVAGFAKCDLDTKTDSYASWRGFVGPALRQDRGHLAESVHFAKYHYNWSNEDFILYTGKYMPFAHRLLPAYRTDFLCLQWEICSTF